MFEVRKPGGLGLGACSLTITPVPAPSPAPAQLEPVDLSLAARPAPACSEGGVVPPPPQLLSPRPHHHGDQGAARPRLQQPDRMESLGDWSKNRKVHRCAHAGCDKVRSLQ